MPLLLLPVVAAPELCYFSLLTEIWIVIYVHF
jgi:hypothetical protein